MFFKGDAIQMAFAEVMHWFIVTVGMRHFFTERLAFYQQQLDYVKCVSNYVFNELKYKQELMEDALNDWVDAWDYLNMIDGVDGCNEAIDVRNKYEAYIQLSKDVDHCSNVFNNIRDIYSTLDEELTIMRQHEALFMITHGTTFDTSYRFFVEELTLQPDDTTVRLLC
jgi:hypothetical protein